MKLNKLALTVLTLISFQLSFSQAVSEDYYLFPIRPGQINHLAGTMGELRPNHFHGGIDIKTGGREGLPVYAAADGYVSRINISPYGYGHALYIEHPNGTSTVYGHLREFNEDIARYATNMQYSKKSFDINVFLGKNTLPVKKGDIVAYSGNTGGSSGPHLHFEIRNKYEEPINPLQFDFKTEIKDNVPPRIYGVSLSPLSEKARINGQFDKTYFSPTKLNIHEYVIKDTVHAYGEFGLAVKANDLLNGVPNHNGVPIIESYLDSTLVYRFSMEKFAFWRQKQINMLIDYEAYQEGRGRYQRLFNESGVTVYSSKPVVNNGILDLQPGVHHIRVLLKDVYGNETTLTFTVKSVKPEKKELNSVPSANNTLQHYRIYRNFMIFESTEPDHDQYLNLHYNAINHISILPDIINSTGNTYIWNLSRGLPDSAKFLDQTMIMHNLVVAIPDRVQTKTIGNVKITFTKKSLFDTLYLEILEQENTFAIGSEKYPLASSVKISYTTPFKYPETEKKSIYQVEGTERDPRYSFEKTYWSGSAATFNTRKFGTYTVLEDTLAPAIKTVKETDDELKYRISDNLSGIDTYNAYINDQWLLMEYDYKRSTLVSKRKNKNTPLKGSFLLEVTDNQGNKAVYETEL